MNKLLTILGIITLWVAIGCEETYAPTGPGHRPVPVASTPADVLENVEIAFNRSDIDLLKPVLSPNFVFYSKPEEIGRPPPDLNSPRPPPSYSYTQFWNIVYNIFCAAYSVSININTAGVGEPGPEENIYSADNVELSLLVMAEEKRGYLAQGYCDFEFEKYRDEQSRELWRITAWWDNTERGGEAREGVARVPLWYILSLYEK